MAAVIGVARETAPGERRVALTPETCRKFIAMGTAVRVQRGLGEGASFADAAYAEAGAELVDDPAAALSQADIVLCVQPPSPATILAMAEGTALVGVLHPDADAARAEAMDVLSSQAGMAGYKAVLLAAWLAPRFFPMLTTAAGTIRPSKVLVVGAGVAGLQAIATAKRLGAQVEGFDVRPETREQI